MEEFYMLFNRGLHILIYGLLLFSGFGYFNKLKASVYKGAIICFFIFFILKISGFALMYTELWRVSNFGIFFLLIGFILIRFQTFKQFLIDNTIDSGNPSFVKVLFYFIATVPGAYLLVKSDNKNFRSVYFLTGILLLIGFAVSMIGIHEQYNSFIILVFLGIQVFAWKKISDLNKIEQTHQDEALVAQYSCIVSIGTFLLNVLVDFLYRFS